MAAATNQLKIFWKLVCHFKAWTFLQIIWHISCAFINITTLFNVIKSIFVIYCYFDLRKNEAAKAYWFISKAYSEFAPSVKTCGYWFWRFKSGDGFDLKDKEHSD